jgi:hypothetical protein
MRHCLTRSQPKKPPTSSCNPKPVGVPQTLEGVIQHYIDNVRDGAAEEMQFYSRQPTLANTIEMAALSKRSDWKRHDHQRRISAETLLKAFQALKGTRFDGEANFSGLHREVNELIGGITGIGPLAVYDMSHRIGAYLGLLPDRVYLHAGTRVGARVLGFRGETVELTDLPEPFSQLTAAEAEDCLCRYKGDLGRICSRITPRRVSGAAGVARPTTSTSGTPRTY